jgi:hypothetical protein
VKDWDKRVEEKANEVESTGDYASGEYFTQGANWAREDMEKRVEQLRLATVDSINALRQQCVAMAEALQWSKEMFVARDEMNSKVHCAPVRLSPITDRVILALAAYQKFKEGG